MIRVLLQTFRDGGSVYDCFPKTPQEVKLVIPEDFEFEVVLVYKDHEGEHIYLVAREFIGEEFVLL